MCIKNKERFEVVGSIYYLFDDLVFLASFLIKTHFPFVVNACPLIFITVLTYKLAVSETTGTVQREELREGRTLAPPPSCEKKNCCREEIKGLFNFSLRWPVHQEEKGDRLVQ